MSEILDIGWVKFNDLIAKASEKLKNKKVYGIPKNGMLMAGFLKGVFIVTDPVKADIIFDDIYDSGITMKSFESYGKPFYFVIDKREIEWKGKWISWPFEREKDIEENIVRMIEYIGEDANREGLKETPARVKKSWRKIYGGYRENPEDVFKIFSDGACDEMVVLKNIEFYSTCEHHLLPFYGSISVGYVPNKKVVGVSKLARLVEVFSRRMQIQERLTSQIVDSIMEHLEPLGAMAVCKATHLCMTSRGVEKQRSEMITSAIRGVFKKDEVRSEFLRLVKE